MITMMMINIFSEFMTLFMNIINIFSDFKSLFKIIIISSIPLFILFFTHEFIKHVNSDC